MPIFVHTKKVDAIGFAYVVDAVSQGPKSVIFNMMSIRGKL